MTNARQTQTYLTNYWTKGLNFYHFPRLRGNIRVWGTLSILYYRRFVRLSKSVGQSVGCNNDTQDRESALEKSLQGFNHFCMGKANFGIMGEGVFWIAIANGAQDDC